MSDHRHIVLDSEFLQTMRPSERGIKFVTKFFQLTKLGRARINFPRDEFKKWIFPVSVGNPNKAKSLLRQYDSAAKLNN